MERPLEPEVGRFLVDASNMSRDSIYADMSSMGDSSSDDGGEDCVLPRLPPCARMLHVESISAADVKAGSHAIVAGRRREIDRHREDVRNWRCRSHNRIGGSFASGSLKKVTVSLLPLILLLNRCCVFCCCWLPCYCGSLKVSFFL